MHLAGATTSKVLLTWTGVAKHEAGRALSSPDIYLSVHLDSKGAEGHSGWSDLRREFGSTVGVAYDERIAWDLWDWCGCLE